MNIYIVLTTLIICATISFLILFYLVLAFDVEPGKFLEHAFLFFTLKAFLPLFDHIGFGVLSLLDKFGGAAEMVADKFGGAAEMVADKFGGAAEMVGVALAQLFSIVSEVLFTPKLFFTLILAIFVELLLGFIYIREEMKEMVKSSTEQLAVALVPIREGTQAAFKTISNPWNLLGYAIFILLIQLTPRLNEAMLKGFEKSFKFPTV